MDKQLHQTLAQVTMYSKMGRYISNKILKYNKRVKTHRSLRNSQPHRADYLKVVKQRASPNKAQSQHHAQAQPIKKQMNMTQPPVGYYKLNFSQVEKNTRVYDFNRSVPHFNMDKYICHENQTVQNELPDSQLCKQRVTGLMELKRIIGRGQVKGSIRKEIEDPHQNRFQLNKDFKSIQFGKTRVNMSKDLPRDNAVFKNNSQVPQNDYEANLPLKRLDTHIIPFDRILDRDQKAIICPKGISDYFDQYQYKSQQRSTYWKKMLPRQKTGLLPSYMDKNINTRSSIGLLNLKTLEMNCSSLREPISKTKNRPKKQIIFIEQNEASHGKNMESQKENVRFTDA